MAVVIPVIRMMEPKTRSAFGERETGATEIRTRPKATLTVVLISDFDDYFSQSSILPHSKHSIFSVAVLISSRPASLILTPFILVLVMIPGKRKVN
jgi:hypothetical protein